jgi:hypothetical protein
MNDFIDLYIANDNLYHCKLGILKCPMIFLRYSQLTSTLHGVRAHTCCWYASNLLHLKKPIEVTSYKQGPRGQCLVNSELLRQLQMWVVQLAIPIG